MASPPASLFRTDYEKYKKALDKEIQQKMKEIYEEWAQALGYRAERLTGAKRMPDRLFLSQMASQLRYATTQIAGEVATAEAQALQKMLADARSASSAFWREAGFDTRVMETYMLGVSQNVINNIASQMVRANNDGTIEAFGLSPAVWGTFSSLAYVCEEAVAKGVAGGQSVKEISKTIQEIVDPFKSWNEGELYSGNTAYCAERLIKTLTQHAYQQEIVQENIENPLCKGIRWHSNGPRACEFCQAMDGKLFKVDQVPLDHPNGMCVLEPVYPDNYEEMLQRWRDNPVGTYPMLDDYAELVGYDLSSTFDSVDALLQTQNARMDGITINPVLDQGLLNKITSTVIKGTKAVKNQFLSIINEKFEQAESAWKNAYALATRRIHDVYRVNENAKNDGSAFYPTSFDLKFKESELLATKSSAYLSEEGSTFFHELGHAIDNCVRASRSADCHMQEAIGRDWEAIMESQELTDKLFEIATNTKYSWTTYGAMQDALSWARFYCRCINTGDQARNIPYFENKISRTFLMFYHEDSYWMGKTVEMGGLKMGGYAVEAFAEFSEIKMMHPEEYEKLREIFPNYIKEYEKAITQASKWYVNEEITSQKESQNESQKENA